MRWWNEQKVYPFQDFMVHRASFSLGEVFDPECNCAYVFLSRLSADRHAFVAAFQLSIHVEHRSVLWGSARIYRTVERRMDSKVLGTRCNQIFR